MNIVEFTAFDIDSLIVICIYIDAHDSEDAKKLGKERMDYMLAHKEWFSEMFKTGGYYSGTYEYHTHKLIDIKL